MRENHYAACITRNAQLSFEPDRSDWDLDDPLDHPTAPSDPGGEEISSKVSLSVECPSEISESLPGPPHPHAMRAAAFTTCCIAPDE